MQQIYQLDLVASMTVRLVGKRMGMHHCAVLEMVAMDKEIGACEVTDVHHKQQITYYFVYFSHIDTTNGIIYKNNEIQLFPWE